tara:strand:+ start:607 stop:987 length:381 start_codon:yes stop_codon:yes gene_type:complete
MSIKNKITRLEEAGVNKILKLLGGKNVTAAGLGIEGVSSILEMLQGVGMAKGGIANQGFSNGGGVDTAPGTTKPEGLSALLMQDSSRLSLRLFGKDLNQLNAEEKQYLERYLEKQIAETKKEEDDE